MQLSAFNVDRRWLLRAGATAAGAVATGNLLAGCDSNAQSGSGEPSGPPKKGGTLTLALYGAAQSDQTDGQHALSTWDIAMSYQLYNSLFSQVPVGDDHKGLQIVPGIAESAEYEGSQKLRIRLRDGVEFHHGKTLTADDVLFSFRRIADPKDPGRGAVDLAAVDLKNSRALDARTVELVLTSPDSFLKAALSGSYLCIYPTDYDPKRPVGTGPWKLKSFNAGQSASFERFANYFDTPAYAEALVFQAYGNETALVHALTSSAANLLANVPASQLRLLQSNRRFTVMNVPTGAPIAMFAMEKKMAPFTDPRVREAFRLMIDRQAIVDQVFGGQATVGNDLFNPFDPAYNHDIPQRAHDPEQAKSLLAQAGMSSLDLTLATGAFAPNMEVVFAQAAKAAGVTLNVKTVDQSTFYAQNYGHDPIFSTGWYARPLPQTFALNSLPKSQFNETQEDNPDIVRYFNEAKATLDEAKQNELLKQVQKVQWDLGGYIIPAFVNQVDAMSSDVQGATPDVTGKPFGQFNFKGMWLS